MTLARWPHEPRRGAHSARKRRTRSPIDLEPLEVRTLLSLTLVKDINKADLYPSQITGAGGKIYFITKATDGGINLDVRTSAGPTVLLKEFNPSMGSSASYGGTVRDLTAVGAKVFFVANTDAAGTELWVTDGTTGGTKIVKDLNPGAGSSYPFQMTPVGNKLFFLASNVPGQSTSGAGYTLFVTDGTGANTKAVPPPAGVTATNVKASELAGFGSKLAFTSGNKLMLTDGATTTAIGTFPSPTTSEFTSPIDDLTAVGPSLYFTAYDGNVPALYKSNGTLNGASVLKDFTPKSSTSSYAVLNQTLGGFQGVGSKLFFSANDQVNGPALWLSDGTAGGTKLLKALPPTSSSYGNGAIESPMAVGSKLFFGVETPGSGTTGLSLWASDGTSAGTKNLGNISPVGANSSHLHGLAAGLNNTLYFSNTDSVNGTELWRSDGTVAGTKLYANINPGVASSFPSNLTTINGTLYFAALNGTDASELWKSNGAAGGSSLVASFKPNATASAFYVGSENRFGMIGNSIILGANNAINGRELWKTDGTAAGTVLIKDLVPGPLSSNPFDFTTVGTRVFFITSTSAGQKLWVTNGTASGTSLVTALSGNVSAIKALNNKLVFTLTHQSQTGQELWVSDGTQLGTTKLKAFGSVGGYGANALSSLNGKLYFTASDADMAPATLWVTDGSANGTKAVVPTPTFANALNLTSAAGKLYFTAFTIDGSNFFNALWTSDGTLAGTKAVSNVPNGASINTITGAGSNVYFFTNTFSAAGQSVALWVSNGTAGGTKQLHDFGNTYFGASRVVGLPNGNLIIAYSPTATPAPNAGFQPWVSDGTVAGTKVLKDIKANFGYDVRPVLNGVFYFSGTDATHGSELWRTDGTAGGTFMVQDINKGKGSSSAGALAIVNGKLVITANDGIHGNELFAGPPPAAPQTAAVHASVAAKELRISSTNPVSFPTVDYGVGTGTTAPTVVPPAPVGVTIPALNPFGDDGSTPWKPRKKP